MNVSKLALALLLVPTSFTTIGIQSEIKAHAEENAIDWIKANWLNYPSNIGKWNVSTINNKTALGTTQNVNWSGFLNTNALQTTDSTFKFKMYQNESSDDDNMGWTFRHTYSGDYKNIKNHSFYVFISNGVNKNGGLIPSGIYKKSVGKNATKNEMELLASISHRRSPKTEYDVNIDVKDEKDGTRIKLYINNKLEADFLDKEPLDAGGYGPFSYSQAYAYFYDIEVNGASFLNVPPTTTITTSTTDGETKHRGDVISVSGTSFDNDYVGANDVKTYYKFDKGEEVLIPTTPNGNGQNVFNEDIKIPGSLGYGNHTLYIYSKDGENGESKKEEIKFFLSDTYDYMVKVIGTFEASTLDVKVPATSTFLYNPNDGMMNAQNLNIINNSNSPVYMNMQDINVAEVSSWKPNLISPTKYTDEEWNNLTNTETKNEVSLGIQALSSENGLNKMENESLWSSDLNAVNKLGVIKTKTGVDVKPILKAGTSLDTQQLLTTNYIFEFGLE